MVDQEALLYVYGTRDPVIAIVHTHGSESFLPAVQAMARARDPSADVSKLDSFSTDRSVNVVRVGEELARYLWAAHGISSVQSRRLHDLKEEGFRLGAYNRSLETMTAILRRHPRVKVLIDLHRDAPGREMTTTVLNGTPVATILVIVGTDRMLENPHWRKNYDFARRLVATMEQMYPGLSRGLLVRDERYNQHVMERTLLLEIGGQENTLEEVFAAVRCLGDILAQLFAEGFDL
jgi:stage II sporulation protein P